MDRLSSRQDEAKTPKNKPVDLGAETSFTELPTRIFLGNRPHYLVCGETGYQLLSTVCPHQGGEVANVGSYFECSQHGWRFEHATGKGINNTGKLSSVPVTVREGHLFAEVSLPSVPAAPMAQRIKRLDQLTIHLRAHACLEIVYKGFSLLTDPWLCGPAFLGSWTQYPPPVVDVSTLRPDAIVITHEHSDHFHEPTLRKFQRRTPIYVPDFPNRRLVERLAVLGFLNVYPMTFGKMYEVSDNFKLTCFEPGSLWNDAIVLVEIDGLRLLNINDAGLNRRIASLVAPVDVVASQFSIGASGYPLTWTHLTEAEKVHIMKRACQGMLQMLREAMDLYKAKYLLPLASHFALWHPSHREYVSMMRTNTLDDVVRGFEGTGIHVIDLLPGESWDIAVERIARLGICREHFYDLAYKLQYLERCFDIRVFEKHYPVSADLSPAGVEAYFLRLNETPEIAFCEDVTVRLRAIGGNCETRVIDVSFTIEAGELRILKDSPCLPNLMIEIPYGILASIVSENISWDEAHIGYWCRFTRNQQTCHH
ncbi:MAG: MBL fold metallo-hydrolase [Candidatus Methylomirabilales bacterium]